MATKLTQKDLQAAMQPLRRATERLAIDLCNGTRQHDADKAIYRAGIEFGGVTVTAKLLRKGRVSCGVPAPYHIFHIHYDAKDADGKLVVGGWEAGSFRPNLIRALAQRAAAAAA